MRISGLVIWSRHDCVVSSKSQKNKRPKPNPRIDRSGKGKDEETGNGSREDRWRGRTQGGRSFDGKDTKRSRKGCLLSHQVVAGLEQEEEEIPGMLDIAVAGPVDEIPAVS